MGTQVQGSVSLNLEFLFIVFPSADRSGLRNDGAVEKIQDQILSTFKRFVQTNRPQSPLHWAKIIMKVTDLRSICQVHAERILVKATDASAPEMPSFLALFGEPGDLDLSGLDNLDDEQFGQAADDEDDDTTTDEEEEEDVAGPSGIQAPVRMEEEHVELIAGPSSSNQACKRPLENRGGEGGDQEEREEEARESPVKKLKSKD